MFNSTPRWKRKEYSTVKRYIPLDERKRISNLRKRDLLYAVVFLLIVVGIAKTTLSPFVPPVSRLASDVTNQNVQASQTIYPTPTPEVIVQYVVKDDERVATLETFLKSKGSPLAPHAAYIIDRSDAHAIDWTLLVSIAGKESGYGKNIVEGSYNAWGIMTWDKEGTRHLRKFGNWEEGIEYVAKMLSENYRANMIAGMQEKYCPSKECANNWTSSILSFAEEMIQSKEEKR